MIELSRKVCGIMEVPWKTIHEIYDEDMNELEVARHPEQVLKLKFNHSLPAYSMIRLITKED